MSKFMALVVVVMVIVVLLAAATVIDKLPRRGGDEILMTLAPLALFVLSATIALAWLCKQIELMVDRIANLNEQIRSAKEETSSVKKLVIDAQKSAKP